MCYGTYKTVGVQPAERHQERETDASICSLLFHLLS